MPNRGRPVPSGERLTGERTYGLWGAVSSGAASLLPAPPPQQDIPPRKARRNRKQASIMKMTTEIAAAGRIHHAPDAQ